MELKNVQQLHFIKYIFTSKSILMNFVLNQRNSSIYNNRQYKLLWTVKDKIADTYFSFFLNWNFLYF